MLIREDSVLLMSLRNEFKRLRSEGNFNSKCG